MSPFTSPVARATCPHTTILPPCSSPLLPSPLHLGLSTWEPRGAEDDQIWSPCGCLRAMGRPECRCWWARLGARGDASRAKVCLEIKLRRPVPVETDQGCVWICRDIKHRASTGLPKYVISLPPLSFGTYNNRSLKTSKYAGFYAGIHVIFHQYLSDCMHDCMRDIG